MSFFKRQWSPSEAAEWSIEDTITVIISPLIYVALTIGMALSMLQRPLGFIILGGGIVLMFFMVYIINPKLSAVSEDYERNQKDYLEDLDRKIKWEDRDD